MRLQEERRGIEDRLSAYSPLGLPLVQVEVNIHNDLYSYGMSLIHCWLELVLLYGFNGFLIETHAEMPRDANVLRIAICVDN
jgi:hypothetical protein